MNDFICSSDSSAMSARTTVWSLTYWGPFDSISLRREGEENPQSPESRFEASTWEELLDKTNAQLTILPRVVMTVVVSRRNVRLLQLDETHATFQTTAG